MEKPSPWAINARNANTGQKKAISGYHPDTNSRSIGDGNMHGKEEDGYVALKLDHNEDIMESMHRAIRDFNIKSGFIIMGIGMLRDVEVGYFAGENYLTKKLKEPHELVALHGSISTKDGMVIHLHCGLATPEHNIIGGHLIGGTVNIIGEILIKKFDELELGRELNPKTGLKELYID